MFSKTQCSMCCSETDGSWISSVCNQILIRYIISLIICNQITQQLADFSEVSEMILWHCSVRMIPVCCRFEHTVTLPLVEINAQESSSRVQFWTVCILSASIIQMYVITRYFQEVWFIVNLTATGHKGIQRGNQTHPCSCTADPSIHWHCGSRGQTGGTVILHLLELPAHCFYDSNQEILRN